MSAVAKPAFLSWSKYGVMLSLFWYFPMPFSYTFATSNLSEDLHVRKPQATAELTAVDGHVHARED